MPDTIAGSAFASLKQVAAENLNVGYAETGPAVGPAVVLLHGWPYDIHCCVDVTASLASAGYRVVVPCLRGFGTTRFVADDTIRAGEQAASAADLLALLDVLKMDQAFLAGFDWGSRTADRGRGRRGVARALQGAGIRERLPAQQPEDRQEPLPPKAEYGWWYQYYFRHRAGQGRL